MVINHLLNGMILQVSIYQSSWGVFSARHIVTMLSIFWWLITSSDHQDIPNFVCDSVDPLAIYTLPKTNMAPEKKAIPKGN